MLYAQEYKLKQDYQQIQPYIARFLALFHINVCCPNKLIMSYVKLDIIGFLVFESCNHDVKFKFKREKHFGFHIVVQYTHQPQQHIFFFGF